MKQTIYSLFLLVTGIAIGMMLCEFGVSMSSLHDFNFVADSFNWTSPISFQTPLAPSVENSPPEKSIKLVILYLRPNLGFFVDLFNRLKLDTQGGPPWCQLEVRSAGKSYLFEALRTIKADDEHNYADFYLVVNEAARVHIKELCWHISTLDPQEKHFESRGVENTIGKIFSKIDLVAVTNHGFLLSRKALLLLAPCHFKGESLSDVKISHCWNVTHHSRVIRNDRFFGKGLNAITTPYARPEMKCVDKLDERFHFGLLTGPKYETDCFGILETWGKNVGNMAFYVHKPIDETICNGTVTDLTPIGCCRKPDHSKGRNQQLPYWIFKWTEIQQMDIDWLVGFDSDSSYNIPLIAKWLPTFPIDIPLILGDITAIWKDHVRYPDGAGIFINRAAIDVVLKHWNGTCEHKTNNLDIWLGYCAINTGITLERLPGTFHHSIMDEYPPEYWQSSYGLTALHRAYGRAVGKKRKRASELKYQGNYQDIITEHNPCI